MAGSASPAVKPTPRLNPRKLVIVGTLLRPSATKMRLLRTGEIYPLSLGLSVTKTAGFAHFLVAYAASPALLEVAPHRRMVDAGA